MACADQIPRMALKDRRVKAPAPMAGKKKGDVAAAKAVDEIDVEKMREALVVVVEELEAKYKGQPGVEAGKEKQAQRSFRSLVQSLVALEQARFQKLLDGCKFVNLEDVAEEADEEHLKIVADLEEHLSHMFDGDWRSRISREARHVLA